MSAVRRRWRSVHVEGCCHTDARRSTTVPHNTHTHTSSRPTAVASSWASACAYACSWRTWVALCALIVRDDDGANCSHSRLTGALLLPSQRVRACFRAGIYAIDDGMHMQHTHIPRAFLRARARAKRTAQRSEARPLLSIHLFAFTHAHGA